MPPPPDASAPDASPVEVPDPPAPRDTPAPVVDEAAAKVDEPDAPADDPDPASGSTEVVGSDPKRTTPSDGTTPLDEPTAP